MLDNSAKHMEIQGKKKQKKTRSKVNANLEVFTRVSHRISSK